MVGPNGIILEVLWSGLNILLPWIGEILRANVGLGHVPISWRIANVNYILEV